jgi:hypothetical protein
LSTNSTVTIVDPDRTPDIESIKEKLTTSLRERVGMAFPAMLADIAASGDLIMLAGIGVDWKQLVREVLQDEIENVLQTL